MTVTAKAADGYKLDGVYMSGTELTEADGVYTFTVPVGGDVEVSAKVTALPKDDPKTEPKDDPKPVEQKKDSTQKSSDAPKTGDEANVWFYGAMILVSLGGMSAAAYTTRRKNRG